MPLSLKLRPLDDGSPLPALDAQSFVWTERIGHGWRVDARFVLPRPIDADEWVGREVAMHLSAVSGERAFFGVVTRVEGRATHDGASVAEIGIESRLGPLTHREDVRAFEHLTTPEIVDRVLAGWSLTATKRLSPAALAAHEFRAQYRESDAAFVRRLLEAEGISLVLEPGADGDAIVLDDQPGTRDPVVTLAHAARLSDARSPSYAALATRRELRTSKLHLRDHDFALPREVDLAATAADPALGAESFALELGAFFTDGRDAAGQRSAVERGQLVATRRLAAQRAGASIVRFETNVVGLHTGAVVRLDGEEHPILVTSIRATEDAGVLSVQVEGVAAQAGFVPALETPRPAVRGVHTARVTGPTGAAHDGEIHVDAMGRVRVEFIWDRRAPEDRSSAWVRVAQGWAGPGMGLVTIPRVGQDVLLGFLDGNPDAPFVVGRLFDASSPHPYALPAHQTKTVLRTQSVPAGEGFNELSFEDATGSELVYMRAERDRETHVRAEDRLRVDASRRKEIGASEHIEVGAARSARVGTVDITEAGERFTAQIAGGRTYLDMSEGRIRLTTGDATFELDGANARIDATGDVDVRAANVTIRGTTNIRVEAGANVRVESAGGDVVVQGGPMVYINPKDAGSIDDAGSDALPVPVPDDVDIVDNVDDARDLASYDPERPGGIAEKLGEGGEWNFLARGKEHRDFHFFHAAMMSRAAGLPLGVLLRQEGARHAAREGADPRRGDPGDGVSGGAAPWGLEPSDEVTMRAGAAFYDERFAS